MTFKRGGDKEKVSEKWAGGGEKGEGCLKA